VKVLTINQIIGANLKDLIENEGLNVEQAAEALTALTRQTFSEVKLWRWESGNYHFKATDLFLLSRILGRNVMAFLEPPKEVGTRNSKEKVTHVIVGETTYTVERYRLDYFLDPRGSFLDRATNLAARKKEAAYDVEAALDDIRDNLGERALLADFHAALEGIRRTLRTRNDIVEEARSRATEDPTPENIDVYNELIKDAKSWRDRTTKVLDEAYEHADVDAIKDIERNTNGVNPEEHK